jgi:iron complex outermembrane receptor protein
MNQRLLTFILFTLIAGPTFAQHGKIRGHIVSKDKNVLPGISIRLEPRGSATQTDDNGNFEFGHVPSGNYILIASGVGYQAKSSEVVVSAGKLIFLSLELDRAASTLKEVSVNGGRPATASRTLTRMHIPLRDLPQNIQSVNRTMLDDQQLFQVDQVFKNVAGITSTDYFGGFSSRGYTSGASGITTNGIKGSPYPEGQIPLLGNIESIEVIHGPSAIVFGPGGMGGNINLVTKQPKKYTAINAAVSAGSFDLFRTQADVSGSMNKKKNLYFLAGAAYQNGGHFTRDFDRRTIQVYGSVKWEITPRTTWQLNGNYINDDASNNYQPRVPVYNSLKKDSIFLVPHDFNPGHDSRYTGNNIQAQSVMEHHFSADWKLGLLIAYNESKVDRKQYTASGYVRTTDNTVSRSYSWQKIHSPQTTINLYGVGKVNTWTVQHQFAIGGDAVLSRNIYPEGILQYAATRLPVFTTHDEPYYDTTGMTLYGNSSWEKFTYNTLGVYILDQIVILPKLKALAGLRYNNYFRRYLALEQDGSIQNEEKPDRTKNFSPRLGLVYQPVHTVSVYIDYNEGFSPQYSNYAEYGGPFDPETSKQYELGIKGEFFHSTLLPFITVYQSTKKNVLQAAPRDGFPYWREAIGEVRSRGVEMGITGTVASNLFINLNYNYNKTKITKSVKPEEIGQLFANAPQNTANGWAKYSFRNGPLKGLFVGGGFQYVDSRYFSNKKVNVTVAEMPAYTVFDALVGYRYKQYSLQVNGNNLGDKRYAASGISSSYTPGMPRNLLVTLSCSFR